MLYVNNLTSLPGMAAGLPSAADAPDTSAQHAMDTVQWASAMSDKLSRLQMFGMAAKKINDQQ